MLDSKCADRFSGGSNTENSWKTTGHCGLGQAIQELGLATKSPLKMDFLVRLLCKCRVRC
jgi:hypothetical protein